MPRPFNPKASPTHKQACLALFRALLRATHCFPPAISTTLHNLIAYDFRQARNTISVHDINAALKEGRQALALIGCTLNGSKTAQTNLTQKIEERTERIKQEAAWRHHCAVTLRQPTRPAKLPKILHLEHHAKKSAHQPRQLTEPDAPPPLLKRFEQARQTDALHGDNTQQVPLLDRIPNLVEAQGIPFLRFTSGKGWERHARNSFHARMVRDLARHDAKRWETREKLEENMLLGRFEDDWDRILMQMCGVRDDDYAGLRSDSSVIPAQSTSDLSNWINLREPVPLHVLDSLRPPHTKPLAHLKSWAHDAFVVDYLIMLKIREETAVRRDTARMMWDFVQLQKKMKAERKEERRRKWLESQGQSQVIDS